MSTANTKITFFAGNYRKLQATITNLDDGGNALDLTSLTVRWTMSLGTISSYSKTSKLLKTEGSGITITDAVNGLCDIEIDSADTVDGNPNGIKPGSYYWELEVEDAANEFEVVAYGEFLIKLNVENV